MAYNRKPGTKKRRRKNKLLRRLFVLSIFVLLLWVVWQGVAGAYRLATNFLSRTPAVVTTVAEEWHGDRGIPVQGLLLRDEMVVLADKPGQVNLVADSGQQIRAGDLIVELVDKALLAEIDLELSRLDREANNPTADTSGELAVLADKLLAAEERLQVATSDYRQALASRSANQYRGLYDRINKAAREVAKLQEDRQRLLSTINSINDRRDLLAERREQAILRLAAPAAGRVFYVADGLEQRASLSNLSPTLWQELSRAEKISHQTNPAILLQAGQPAYKILRTDCIHLLVQATEEDIAQVAAGKGLRVQSADLNSGEPFAVEIVSRPGLAADQILLQIDMVEGAVKERLINLFLHPEGELLHRLPMGALLEQENKSFVMILEDTIARAHEVTIRQREGRKHVVVSGLPDEATIITNPKRVSDGEDVAERLKRG